MPHITRWSVSPARKTTSRSLPVKALTRRLVTTTSLPSGVIAGRGSLLLGAAEGQVAQAHLGHAGAESDDHVDHRNGVGASRAHRLGDARQVGGGVRRAVDDPRLDVHHEQRGAIGLVGHGPSLQYASSLRK
jgi:hypothetical protein